MFQGRAVGHNEEGGLGAIGCVRLGVDGANAVEGDGGEFFVEAETGSDSDGEVGKPGGDPGDIARQVLLDVDAVDEEVGLDGGGGCAGVDAFGDGFGEGGAAEVEEAGLGDGRGATLAEAGGEADHGGAAVAVQAAVADENDALHWYSDGRRWPPEPDQQGLRLGKMEAALELVEPDPAAGAQVVAGLDGLSAGPAADAGVVPLVQLVVGDVVGMDVGPDVRFGPFYQRSDFDDIVLVVPAQDRCAGPCGRLVAAQGGDPGGAAVQGLAHGDDFADAAALVGVAAVEVRAVGALLFGDAHIGRHAAEGAVVVALGAVDQGDCFGEEVVGVDVEDVNIGVDAHGHVDQGHAAGSEG